MYKQTKKIAFWGGVGLVALTIILLIPKAAQARQKRKEEELKRKIDPNPHNTPVPIVDEDWYRAQGTEINARVEKGIKWPCWNSETKQWCWCTSGSMHCKARGVKIRD